MKRPTHRGVADEHLPHNRCDLNAFDGRDTLGDTLRDTLSTSGKTAAVPV